MRAFRKSRLRGARDRDGRRARRQPLAATIRRRGSVILGGTAVVVRAGDRTCATINVTLAGGRVADDRFRPRRGVGLPQRACATSSDSCKSREAQRSPRRLRLLRPSATKPGSPPATGSPPGNGWRWAGLPSLARGPSIASVGAWRRASQRRGAATHVASQRPAGSRRCTASGYSVRQALARRRTSLTGLIGGAVAAAGGLLRRRLHSELWLWVGCRAPGRGGRARERADCGAVSLARGSPSCSRSTAARHRRRGRRRCRSARCCTRRPTPARSDRTRARSRTRRCPPARTYPRLIETADVAPWAVVVGRARD